MDYPRGRKSYYSYDERRKNYCSICDGLITDHMMISVDRYKITCENCIDLRVPDKVIEEDHRDDDFSGEGPGLLGTVVDIVSTMFSYKSSSTLF